MSKNRKSVPKGEEEGLRYERLAFVLLVFFVFLIPTKFGLINLDIPDRDYSPIPNFFDVMDQWPDEMGQIVIILIFLLWMMGMSSIKKIRFRTTKASYFLWGFIAVGIISTIRSVIVHSSILHLKSFICYTIFFHLVVNLADTERKQKYLIGSFLLGTALIGLVGLHQYFFGLEKMVQNVYQTIPKYLQQDYIARIERGRIFSTFTYPNSLAGFLLTAIPLSLSVLLTSRNWFGKSSKSKVVLYLLLVVVPVLASFLLTESKGSFLALGLVALFALPFLARHLKIPSKAVVFLLVAVIVLASILVMTPIGKVLVEKGKYTFGERVQYWRAAVEMVPLRPLLGSGFFSFSTMYNKYRSVEANDTRTVHNNYLQLLVETGAVGLICFLGFWIAICIIAARSMIARLSQDGGPKFDTIITAAASLGILGFLLHNIVDFDLYIPGIALSAWFLAALVVRNSGSLKERSIVLRKNSMTSIILVAVTAISLFGVFLTVKTLWGRLYFYIAYSIEQDPLEYREYEFPYDQARIEINNAIWLDGINHNYYNFLGNLYFHGSEFQDTDNPIAESIKAFKRAISLNRYSPVHRFHLVNATRKLMELERNIDHGKLLKLWQEVVEYAPTASYYRVFYADQLQTAGKHEEAMSQYRRALDMDAGLQNALQKARGRYNEDRFIQAKRLFDKLIEEEKR